MLMPVGLTLCDISTAAGAIQGLEPLDVNVSSLKPTVLQAPYKLHTRALRFRQKTRL